MPPSYGDNPRRQEGEPGRQPGRPKFHYEESAQDYEEGPELVESGSQYAVNRPRKPGSPAGRRQVQTESPERIDPGKRSVALIIDLLTWYLLGAIINVIPLLVHLVSNNSVWVLLLLTRDFWFQGRGIGKNFMGMRVVDAKTGAPCTLKQSVLRNIIILAPCAVLTIISVILTLVPLDWLREAVKSVTNVIGAVYLAIILPMECYRAYSRDDSLRLGDSWAGTVIVESDMDFHHPFSRN